MRSALECTIQINGNHDGPQTRRSLDQIPGGTYEPILMCISQHAHVFGWCKSHVLSKKISICMQLSVSVTHNHQESNPQLLYYPTDGGTTRSRVYWLLDSCSEFWLSIEATDYWSNFAKTILFENCSCFSKIPFSISVESPRIFQCLISIPAGHWVRQIDSDLPRRFFLSALLSLVISMTRRSERSAGALRNGADVVREAMGNQFCVQICDMFRISKCRGDWDLGLCTTSVLALGERMRDGKIRETKTCFDAGKIGFCHCLRFYKRKFRRSV